MVMIAVVTALAMRLPNPRMVAIDFLYGTLAALPLGALFFLVIMPATQQSMLLLCISLAVMAFFIGIEVQKRRLGSLGALAVFDRMENFVQGVFDLTGLVYFLSVAVLFCFFTVQAVEKRRWS